ncbi:MAG: FtsH protease activity modulator HflK [Ectothiorhodospiraceae bacterium]|nr:FtsH protease activity modulator HflK [Chromatiales bacterium]MCP5157115.1 FtsH protease activity modulator HflK [Ectothiorhodospiraceae bacterium]
MSWNQPGGNGGRDPWGDRGGQQGPPDLDEVLRKLQARLSKLLSGKPGSGQSGGDDEGGGPGRGGGGGSSMGRISAMGFGAILVALLVAWGMYGIYIVDPSEQAVVLRFGKYQRTEGPGPHWVPPFIETYEKVNVTAIRNREVGFRSQGSSVARVPNESLMLTADENIVDIQFAVQYRVKDPAAFLFRVDDPESTLQQVTESAVREIVGRSRMDFVITEGRDAVAAETERLIQEILDRYGTGLEVTSANMQDAQAPAQVQDAFFDAIKAREDQERIINEANGYKADVVPKARGEAQAITQAADAYRQRVTAQAEGETARFLEVLGEYRKAPDVTRERLYLETVESMLANSSKVLIDVEGGNNLLYLPIDKLIEARPGEARHRIGDPLDQSTGETRPSYESSRRSREGTDGRSR